jgi:hypothetical protein
MPTLSLVAFLVSSGFYSLYAASVRTVAANRMIHRRTVAQAMGLGLMLIALALAISTEGLGAGIFTFFIILMTLGSLIILLAPLNWLDYRSVGPAFSLMVICEIYFF